MYHSSTSENGGQQQVKLLEGQVHADVQAKRLNHIYATDLVYLPECWKLCGDAHCCNFARYKSKFRFIGRSFELHLLPGEYEFLAAKGWLTQFEAFQHKVIEFPIDGAVLKIESIVSNKPNCICEHNTRTVMCRLYPRLPVFNVAGHLVGTEVMGIFEEMEGIAKLSPACQVTSLPLRQLEKFLAIAEVLAQDPQWLFYLEAYRLTKLHVKTRLAAQYVAGDRNIFNVMESAFLRNKLIKQEEIRMELSALASRFRSYYGEDFRLS